MTASWLMGVFVFALLIGDIRDIVGNARRNALSFQRHLDAITTYMNNNKVAKPVQVGFPIFILLCTYLPFFICALPHIIIKCLNRKWMHAVIWYDRYDELIVCPKYPWIFLKYHFNFYGKCFSKIVLFIYKKSIYREHNWFPRTFL